MTRRFAVYARVSTDEQAQHGTSLEGQVEACRALALKLGATAVRAFVDAGISGTDMGRPGLQALLAAARSREVEAVACLDPDRLARNLSHQLIVTDELEALGVELHFAQFERRPTPDGRLLYAIRGAIAEFEAYKIRERTRQGKQQRAREGRVVTGTQILGYAYDRRRKAFVVDVAEAAIVRAIFGMVATMSTHAIAAALNAQGLRAKGGGAFSQSAIYGILRNPTYLGEMLQLKGQGRVRVPPLVDRQTFDGAARALAERRRRPQGHGRVYILSGIARCALCGARLAGSGGARPYYACAGRRGEPACRAPYYPAEEIEQAVWTRVVASLETAALEHPRGVETWAAGAVARERGRLAGRRRRLVQAAASGRLTPEDLSLALGQLEARLRALLLETSPAGPDDASAAMAYLRSADAVARRDVLRALGLSCAIAPDLVEITLPTDAQSAGDLPCR